MREGEAIRIRERTGRGEDSALCRSQPQPPAPEILREPLPQPEARELEGPAFPPFEPHPLVRNRHAQTLATALPRRGLKAFREQAVSRVFEVSRDARLVGLVNRRPEPDAPVLVLWHGLTGCADGDYMAATAAKAWEAGFHTVRMNMRSCGSTESLSRGLYHAGQSGDVARVCEALVRQEGWRRVHLAGFSLGGNLVLRLAGEYGRRPPAWLRSVTAISPPVDLALAVETLEAEPANRIYTHYFLRNLRRLVERKSLLQPDAFDPSLLEGLRSMREFDDRFTAPLGGFHSALDYYRRTSPAPLLPRICVPTLILHARDDTFLPADPLESPEVRANPYLRVVLTEHGGHNAFIARRPARTEDAADPDRRWAENRLLQFIRWHEEVRRSA